MLQAATAVESAKKAMKQGATDAQAAQLLSKHEGTLLVESSAALQGDSN